MARNLEVVVAIPGGDVWHSDFAISLLGLVSDFTQRIPGYNTQRVRIYRKTGSLLPALRQKMLDEALKVGATHMLFIDSDQTFPSNTLRRLLSHNVPVVACNVAIKTFPCSPTARSFDPDNRKGRLVFTTENSRGLERVWRIGTGVLLLDLDICRFLGPRPWFNLRWHPEIEEFEGEDWYFVSKLEEAGYHIYIDHELSWQVGHVGKVVYKHDFVVAAKVYEESSKPEHSVEIADLAACGLVQEVVR